MAAHTPEDEYFARLDSEQKEKIKNQLDIEAAKQALLDRKHWHYHRCGKCGAEMTTHAFKGVEIEVCGECGAVLLDHGELEKLAGHDKSGLVNGIRGLFGR